MDTTDLERGIAEPERWGLPAEAIAGLADRLHALWTRFRPCFQTTTRDGSPHAWVYLRGVLTMSSKRTFANIARRVVDPADDGQALQQFMSDSPWSAQAVIHQVQTELAAMPALEHGGMLILDESADAKAGLHSAGAARQWNGRLGKVDLCQVGVFLAFATATLWTWIDGELFLPEQWFAPELADERRRLGIPPDRQFATKVELGWQMIQRALAAGMPFEVLLCDELYGRSQWLRHQVRSATVVYLADVPADTQVYLTPPMLGVPVPRGRRGRPPTQLRVLNRVTPLQVRQVVGRADTTFRRFQVRDTERGVSGGPLRGAPGLDAARRRGRRRVAGDPRRRWGADLCLEQCASDDPGTPVGGVEVSPLRDRVRQSRRQVGVGLGRLHGAEVRGVGASSGADNPGGVVHRADEGGLGGAAWAG